MPKISKRATTLLHRLYEGHWYPDVTNMVGPVMQELIDAELVVSVGRVAKIVRCYVPKGTRPDYKPSTIPEKPKWLTSSEHGK